MESGLIQERVPGKQAPPSVLRQLCFVVAAFSWRSGPPLLVLQDQDRWPGLERPLPGGPCSVSLSHSCTSASASVGLCSQCSFCPSPSLSVALRKPSPISELPPPLSPTHLPLCLCLWSLPLFLSSPIQHAALKCRQGWQRQPASVFSKADYPQTARDLIWDLGPRCPHPCPALCFMSHRGSFLNSR